MKESCSNTADEHSNFRSICLVPTGDKIPKLEYIVILSKQIQKLAICKINV